MGHIKLTSRQRSVVNALPGSIEDLSERVFGDRFLKADEDYAYLRNLVRLTRRALEPHGKTICSGSRGRHKAYYRLVDLPKKESI